MKNGYEKTYKVMMPRLQGGDFLGRTYHLPLGAVPYLLDETPAYAVVFKPPHIHSVPLKLDGTKNLLHWYARIFPEVLQIQGRKLLEGGILHRLDYDTQGLVLFAKTQAAMDQLNTQQETGLFIKEYGALSALAPADPLPGFPPAPPLGSTPLIIASAFRPYGPGRKAVRPVPVTTVPVTAKDSALDQGKPYQTEITALTHTQGFIRLSLRIKRGFRHQIRCHLAWIGHPILNDTHYGGAATQVPGFLALCAQGISFYDPDSGEPRHYTISPS
ncbi:MAG: RNA pseudouridine synthase [Treponema sp.]|jgi:23S rRNA pseudouridine1911/1915/1917 synthase|nr:RNA pseudouridine synthase [Treponema sp.]